MADHARAFAFVRGAFYLRKRTGVSIATGIAASLGTIVLIQGIDLSHETV